MRSIFRTFLRRSRSTSNAREDTEKVRLERLFLMYIDKKIKNSVSKDTHTTYTIHIVHRIQERLPGKRFKRKYEQYYVLVHNRIQSFSILLGNHCVYQMVVHNRVKTSYCCMHPRPTLSQVQVQFVGRNPGITLTIPG